MTAAPKQTAICMVAQAYYDTDSRLRRKAEALVAAGYQVDVLCLRPPERTTKEYSLEGVQVCTLSLAKERGSLARYAFEYVAFFTWVFFRTPLMMRRRRYAIIDVNTLPDFLIFAPVLARWMGAKLILDMHEITPEFYMSKYDIPESSWIVRLLERQEKASFDFADHVLTIHEPIQDLLVNRGLCRAKSTVIMNSSDEGRFGPIEQRGGNPHTQEEDKFVMIYHGTLTKLYGLDIAIEAFARVHDQMPRAELWILGSGPEAKPLASLAEQHGLTSKVKLMGRVASSEIPKFLAQSTVGLLPIRRDVFLDFAFPNKLPECIIAGKAVIVSRLKTIKHYFSEDALAFFEPHDVQDLANQMTRLYGDRCLRDRLNRRATEEYAAFRWDIMRERYLSLISQLSSPGPTVGESRSSRSMAC